MNKKFEIGDIVYEYKKGLGHRYEVVDTYKDIEYFKVKKIRNFDPLDMAATSALFCTTEYFKPIPWILRRIVLVEKMKKPMYIEEISPVMGLVTRYYRAILEI